MSTRARVHGRNELEARGQDHRASRPDDRDPALLERLAQRLEDIPAELGQLVEEQHALVGAGHLTGGQDRSPADHPGVRDRVVGGPERPPAVQLGDRSLAGRRTDRGGREGIGPVEGRQQARDRPGEERLAGSRRPDKEEPVPAGERDLEGPAGDRLPADVGEIRHLGRPRSCANAGLRVGSGSCRVRSAEVDPGRIRPGRRRSSGPDRGDGGRQVRCSVHLDPLDKARLGRRFLRNHDPRDAASCQCGDHREDPGDAAQLAAQRELADERPRAVRPGLLGAEQDSHGDRRVERGAGLAQVGRGEVHRDSPGWKDEPAVADRSPDALTRLLERGVCQAHDREAGQAGATSTSTRITRPSIPWRVAERTVASIARG
jgi:hypothetical protein